ncbi:MAG: beta-propeller domain-containing protein [Candidatus Diapherotrites archaeon]
MNKREIMNKGEISILFILFLLSLAVIGCTVPEQLSFEEIPRFESYAAMVAAFEDSQNMGRNYGMMDMAVGMAVPLSAGVAESNAKASYGTDYSETNVQVQGVDEADIIKSDGKYIYNFSNNYLVITDAYPIESSQMVSKTDLENVTPQEMFVSGNKLLLFGYKYEVFAEEPMPATPEMYYPSWRGGITAQLYDISDKRRPILEKEIVFEGNYVTSRLIEGKAFFVINSYPHYCYRQEGGCGEDNIIPLMKQGELIKPIAEATDIGYIYPMPAYNFVTIASMEMDSGKMEKETIAGNAESVFASNENIYLASTAWLSSDIPVVKDVQTVVWGNEETTIINKFNLTQGINFVGQGQVKGHALNQFSMDEFEGNFRIATTSGQVSRNGSESTNNLYILDKEMKLIGTLEDLAPGEKIYSARFMGKKAYMVTFKKVDPLFVIDVSNPYYPKVLGKLKIPGYSDYLHPIDEHHLIGIGKDAIESKEGDFAWYQGMKMAIFDVSDVANPIEMHKIIIGDRGTDSYALQDHKAFLYDKEKELLIIPITLAEISEEQKQEADERNWGPAYGTQVFQGAFVFKVNLSTGFTERGRITHISEEEELKRGYGYGYDYQVQRSLYIENVLYTLSNKMLKANDLTTLEKLKEFEFNTGTTTRYDYYEGGI